MNRIGLMSNTGAESTGSPAYATSVSNVPRPQYSSQQLNRDTVCFRSQAYAQPKKKNTFLKWVLGLTATAAVAFAGLAYAHNTKALSKLSDGKLKDFLKKGEPLAEKCYNLYKTGKDKCVECWNKVFKKNK